MHRKKNLLFVVSIVCLVAAGSAGAATKATSPSPADGATGVMTPLLTWTPAEGALFEDVYLGTTAELTAADRVSHQLAMLKMYYRGQGFTPGQTYYWRVDGVSADGKTVYTGDVWSFTAAPLIAFNPMPWDKAKWVELNAELSWSAGLNAQSHDVYFGTDQAAVTARDAAVSKGNQPTTKYTPGALKELTSYYWAVDERDTAGNTQKGDVWSFTTTGPGGGVKAEYFNNMDLSGEPALTRTDPAIDFSWGDPGGPGDPIGVNQFSARWTADLEALRTETFRFITSSDDGVRLWLDGKLLIDNWTDHGTTENIAIVNLVGGRIYALRMEYYENTGGAVASLAWESPSVARQVIPGGPLQLPLLARCVYPSLAAVDTPQLLTLRWEAGDKASEHNIYFGDSADAVANATPDTPGIYRGRQELDAVSYDLDKLEWNKTYYWRVDELSDTGEGPWKGSVWDFTTADFIVIDNFELYTNDSPNRVFQRWIDGWGFTGDDFFPNGNPGNGTGGMVGYDPTLGDIMEKTFVHGGRQSMPFEYNNVGSPYCSEAIGTWPTPEDWTVNGVTDLRLYFQGSTGNSLDRLYVAIEDKAGNVDVAVYPDSNRLTASRWTEWRIPLTTFADAGVNLAWVKKMTIGVGDRNSAKPGGAGHLFIDDIAVVKPGPGTTIVFSENFEGLPLGKNVDEGTAGDKVWTKTAPAGWTIDDKGIPGVGNPAQDGVTEWAGWSFADKAWWTTTAGDQDRSLFTLGSGAVAIADPDEWDDADHATGWYNTYLSTPAIDISGASAGELALTFDSSWRPEYDDDYHQTGNLTVSFDGAKAVELFRWESNSGSPNYKDYATNETVKVPIEVPAGATKMVLTFGLFDAGNDWWWAIDNVEITGVAQ